VAPSSGSVPRAKKFREVLSEKWGGAGGGGGEVDLAMLIEHQYHEVDSGGRLVGPSSQLDLVGDVKDRDCFAEADTRILTNWGLLFLDQIEWLLWKGYEVLFACYEEETQTLVYCKGELVYRAPPEYLVEFTSAGEDVRWAQGSGDYGTEGEAEDSSRSRHVSLRVTPGHKMYVQRGNISSGDYSKMSWSSTRGRRDPATGKQPSAVVEPHRKVPAHVLLSPDNPRACVRMLAYAEAGYAPQSTCHRLTVQDVKEELQLNATQFTAFLELLGFWLGDGSMHYKPVNRLVRGYVEFKQVKQTDLAWLRAAFREAGLKKGEGWLTGSTGIETMLYINKPAWFAFFDAEFGRKYRRSQYYRAAAATPPSTTRSLPRSPSSSSRSASSSSSSPLSVSTSLSFTPRGRSISSRTRNFRSVRHDGVGVGLFADPSVEHEVLSCVMPFCGADSYEPACDMCIDVSHALKDSATATVEAKQDVSMDDGESDGKVEDSDYSPLSSDTACSCCPSEWEDPDVDAPVKKEDEEDEPLSRRRARLATTPAATLATTLATTPAVATALAGAPAGAPVRLSQSTLDAFLAGGRSQPPDDPFTIVDYDDDEVKAVEPPGGGSRLPVPPPPLGFNNHEESVPVTFHAEEDDGEDEMEDEPVKLETPMDDDSDDSDEEMLPRPTEEEDPLPPPRGMPPGWGITWGPNVKPDPVKSVKHLPAWTLEELSRDEMRLIIAGLHRADGSYAGGVKLIYTSSARFRDQLMQALLHCGYSAWAGLMYPKGEVRGYYDIKDRKTYTLSVHAGLSREQQRNCRPIKATADAWKVCWTELDHVHNSAAAGSCLPSMSCQQGVKRVPYNEERDGRTWCVKVEHKDHLIIAQRAQRGLDGTVTKQTRPIVVGNCIIVEDIVDTASTITRAAEERKRKGARDVYAFASHGLFSDNALDRIAASELREVVVTNTVPMSADDDGGGKVTQLTLAPLLAESIKRIHLKQSILSLFELHGTVEGAEEKKNG
jgi:hypothetical protein